MQRELDKAILFSGITGRLCVLCASARANIYSLSYIANLDSADKSIMTGM
jgi:hypothetical protein